jgi:hypothetical protein
VAWYRDIALDLKHRIASGEFTPVEAMRRAIQQEQDP